MRHGSALFKAAVTIALLVFAPLTQAQAEAPQAGLSRAVEAWMASPHGHHGALSFTYWNKDGAVPVACAACHSGPGFADFIGADGSAPGMVDKPAAINAPVSCAVCHTGAAHALDRAVFPSGVEMAGLGVAATCTTCHMGRQAGAGVSAATQAKAEDEVAPDLGFLNIHYGVAAAMMHGAEVGGGYEYPGKVYAGRFAHVPSANTCTACHEPHALSVASEGCMACHRGAETLRDIRMRPQDFDGDGQTSGGIAAEIAGLHARLSGAINVYAAEVAGAPIGYANRFPYFFADTNGDGTIGEDEATRENAYKSWTPRLLKAAFNYQVIKKDPGAYVHNPAYAVQLLHDSLESLGARAAIDTGGIRRPWRLRRVIGRASLAANA